MVTDQQFRIMCEALVMKLVTVMLPESYLEGLHELAREGMYPSRSAAIRMAIRDMLKMELWKEQSDSKSCLQKE